MIKKIKVLPYKMCSESARDLSRSLKCLRLYLDRAYRYKRNHIIINWGNSTMPDWWTRTNNNYIKVLNHPMLVKQASNKLSSYMVFDEHDVPCPSWTTSSSDVVDWLGDGYTVYARTKLNGHSGQGIVIINNMEELIDAPVYTKQFDAGKEYRVHVFRGKVIDFVKKGRKRDSEERASHLIRNYSKGWVFIREGIQLSEVVKETAIAAVSALGLDFGAVDIATHKEDEQKVCVYEVNTSPGLQGTTLLAYTNAIKGLLI